jgi:ABC-type transport system involved in multi-copper enzyme maturation permease subunit
VIQGFRRAVYAEWTKLVSVPSSLWLVGGLMVLTVGLGTAINGTLHAGACRAGQGECNFVDTTRMALLGAYVGQIPAIVLGVLVASSEYANGTMRTTLLAMPRRMPVYLAKAFVLVSSVLCAAVLAIACSLLVARFVQSGNGFTPAHGYAPLSMTEGPTLRAALGTVIYLALMALLGLGVAMALRDTAASLTSVLVLLFGFPILGELVNRAHWHDVLYELSPMTAGLTVQVTHDLQALPIGPWQGLGVVSAYAAAALLGGAAVFLRRDA